MSQFDGIAESNLILARLKDLAGGRVYDAFPDETQIAKFSDGSVKPFLYVNTGTPFRVLSDRTIGSEREQPHRMTISVLAVAGIKSQAKALGAEALNRLLGWAPSANSTVIVSDGGGATPAIDAVAKPSRFEAYSFLSCRINQSPVINEVIS